MFQVLHRIYQVLWAALLIGMALWVYPRTGLSAPLQTCYQVWQNSEGERIHEVTLLTGKVVQVTSGTSFVLKSSDGQLYSIGLVGAVEKPKPAKDRAGRETGVAQKQLSGLVLSNQVDVSLIALDNQHRGLGIAYAGGTNVNAMLISSGAVELNRSYIRSLPLRAQYALIRADLAADRP